MEKKSSSVSKAMGMLPPCNLPAAIIVVVQYSGYLAAILRHLFCRQFGNIHVDSVVITCVQCSHCKCTRLSIAERMLVHNRNCLAT